MSDSGATRPGGVWCIVVAGGSGSRFGGLKQFAELCGSTVIDISIATARSVCDGVVVVIPATIVGTSLADIADADAVVAGGATRSASVRAGLVAVPESAEVILVHDAARPLASVGLFRTVVDAVLAGAEAVVPAVAIADTLRSVAGGTVERDQLRAVQTPQGFDAEALRGAHSTGGDATDDATLVERRGSVVTLIEGESTNFKITEQVDLIVASLVFDAVT